MNHADSIEMTKILLLLSLVLFCSITDLSTRRIPNAVLLPALMTSFFLNSVAGGIAGLTDSIAGLALGILMLLPLHVFGRMGAGDIKLLGVVGSILGGWGAIVAGLATMMAGGLLALAYVVWIFLKPGLIERVKRTVRWFSGEAETGRRNVSYQLVRSTEIPYAVAVAVGSVATLFYMDLVTGIGIA